MAAAAIDWTTWLLPWRKPKARTQERFRDPSLINLRAIYTDLDRVQLQFWRGEERLLYVDLTREQAKHWGEVILTASEARQIEP